MIYIQAIYGDHIPDLAAACMQSVADIAGENYKLIRFDACDNPAAMSDYHRITLLQDYPGAVWIDWDIELHKPLPETGSYADYRMRKAHGAIMRCDTPEVVQMLLDDAERRGIVPGVRAMAAKLLRERTDVFAEIDETYYTHHYLTMRGSK